jgi:heptosyltransferase-1
MSILLVKTSSLGDVVHNLPVVSDLAARFPGVAIDWVVEEAFVDIPRLHPALRRVIPVALRRWRKAPLAASTWREIAAFRRTLRGEHYAHVLDTQGLVKSALITAAAPGRRLGHGRGSAREALAALFYDDAFVIPRELHAVARNRRLAAAAFGYALDMPLDYAIAAPPLAADWLPRQAYAVLLTASSRADKLWPDASWRALAEALATHGLACVLPAGSSDERRRAAALAAAMDNAVAAPALGIAALAGLFAGARLVVGVDTGLTHLAAALGRPTLGIYAATDPGLTGVHAGVLARNLGGAGRPPAAAAVAAAASELLAGSP